ncbi:hypothetical protein AB1Y20_022357 [Prymnesium parvum]|uniref:Uncharacterized protein n=1 Tax=Prymnesium parvum TaxID=97485 RepID=A0AB34JIK8_PRYPA
MLVAPLAALALAPSPIPPTSGGTQTSSSPSTRAVAPSFPDATSSPKAGPRKAAWLPGSYAPSYLDGSLPGDVGFDPYCLTALARTDLAIDDGRWSGVDRKAQMVMCTEYEAKRKVAWMREAEIKHSRLAMLAAAGWPMSELLDGPLSKLLGLPYELAATAGRAPTLLTGNLFEGPQGTFIALVTLATAVLELNTLDNVQGLTPTDYIAGDLGFDPLGLRSKRGDMATAEIKHGRLAMLAVVGFGIQEAVYGIPVIQQTPQFFRPALPF